MVDYFYYGVHLNSDGVYFLQIYTFFIEPVSRHMFFIDLFGQTNIFF